jgi:CheY-like chemotaxis protein
LTPVLAVSASASAEDRARSLCAGSQAHLATPCGGIELVAAVADAIARV